MALSVVKKLLCYTLQDGKPMQLVPEYRWYVVIFVATRYDMGRGMQDRVKMVGGQSWQARKYCITVIQPSVDEATNECHGGLLCQRSPNASNLA